MARANRPVVAGKHPNDEPRHPQASICPRPITTLRGDGRGRLAYVRKAGDPTSVCSSRLSSMDSAGFREQVSGRQELPILNGILRDDAPRRGVCCRSEYPRGAAGMWLANAGFGDSAARCWTRFARDVIRQASPSVVSGSRPRRVWSVASDESRSHR